MAVSPPTSGFVDPSGLSFEPPGSAMPPAGLLGMPPLPTLGPSGPPVGLMSAAAPPPTALGTEYDGHGETPATFGPHDTIRLRFGSSSDSFSPAEYKAYLEGGGDIDAAYAVREAASPWVPASAPTTSSGPPGYSFITGTVDPTAAEIVAAAAAAGMPIPPGFDPIAFSKMMSGGPSAFPTGPPTSLAPSMTAMSAPLAAPVAPPPTAIPPAMPSLMPTAIPAPMPIATSPRISAAVSKPPTRMRGGAGPYMGCDPITGKCPPYR